jgi:hypothetical protein
MARVGKSETAVLEHLDLVAQAFDIEIWLRSLVRKLLKCGSFTAVTDLQAKVLAFVENYNRSLAKPFKWSYQGKSLTAKTMRLLRARCTRVIASHGLALMVPR